MFNLGHVYHSQNKIDDAVKILRECLDIQKQIYYYPNIEIT